MISTPNYWRTFNTFENPHLGNGQAVKHVIFQLWSKSFVMSLSSLLMFLQPAAHSTIGFTPNLKPATETSEGPNSALSSCSPAQSSYRLVYLSMAGPANLIRSGSYLTLESSYFAQAQSCVFRGFKPIQSTHILVTRLQQSQR